MSAKWLQVNQALIAKSIGELSYEQVLKPAKTARGYELKLASGVTYRFEAWLGIWDHLVVKAGLVFRENQIAEEAGQFFIDARVELGMSEITLGTFLEEMYSTLHADQVQAEKFDALSVDELATWGGLEIQTCLNGHPKLLLNKGRMGWGLADLNKYAPETAAPFQLRWIAIRRDLTLSSGDVSVAAHQSLSAQDRKCFARLASQQAYFYVPVHPWQWDRVLAMQFAGELARGEIVDLGMAGDLYQPQISLRTLSNVARPQALDVKLPLTILNTSAVRGISGRYIESSVRVSSTVAGLCREDQELRSVTILEDQAAVSYQHPLFSQVRGAPYRYHETLAAIWRESAESKLAPGETAILTGALFHKDARGCSLVGAYIRRSGLTTEAWLTRYFDAVVIPLYHLQVKYGIGLVAHGQNVVLKLRDFSPTGVLLKDFHGDLRLSSEASAIESLSPHLEKLPPEYLIHDLVTGHFVTVLRFVSETLQECDGYHEVDFYRLLNERVRKYLGRVDLSIDSRIELLGKTTLRVLLNKVRFQIGYGDSAERPRPMLGADLQNPLTRGFDDAAP